MTATPALYRRVLLKLSGEALMGDLDYGIEPEVIQRIAGEISEVHKLGIEIAIVIGGGNIFRGAGLARAGMDRVTGDYMAEDPLCTHEPGTYPAAADLATRGMQYGHAPEAALTWDPEARQRMKQIPAFVRGMVTRSVESHCRKQGIPAVTVAVLDEIRSCMPAPPIFGRKPKSP